MSSDFLFNQPSFNRGVGSLGNLSGTVLSNSSSGDGEADAKALLSDWVMVGRDIKEAMSTYAKTNR